MRILSFVGSLVHSVRPEGIARSRFSVREFFSASMEWTARRLARSGVTPNTVTALSLVPGLASGIAAACGAFYLAAACLLLSGLCDAIDGALARVSGQATRYGALLDSTIDRLCDAAPLAGLTIYFADRGYLVIIPAAALLGGYTISYIRARAEGLRIVLPHLWMRRADRLILVTLALLLGPSKIGGIHAAGTLTLAVLAALAVLTVPAAFSAMRAAAREFDKAENSAPGLIG